MLDCQVALLENAIARYQASGEVPERQGSMHPSITPFGAFATWDGEITIAAGNDKLFAELCLCLDRPDLAEQEAFATNEARTANAATLQEELEARLTLHDSAHWLAEFQRAGIPCGPINNIQDVLADPQIRARNMLVSLDRPQGKKLEVAGNPIKLSAVDDPTTRPAAPLLDADRAKILAELARR